MYLNLDTEQEIKIHVYDIRKAGYRKEFFRPAIEKITICLVKEDLKFTTSKISIESLRNIIGICYLNNGGFCLMLYLLLHSSVLLAADISISSSDSIQTAIASASSGDVLILSSGTYSECLNTSGKNLTIRGNSVSTTTIDGSSCSTNSVEITGGENVIFENVSLKNTNGRVFSVEGSTLTLENVNVSDSGSNSTNGPAVHASNNANVTINNSTFEDNGSSSTSGTAKGGSIYIDNDVNLTINNSSFEGSYAYKGGAVFALNNSSIVINGSDFDGNMSSYTGGCIMLDPSSMSSQNTLTIQGSTFVNNKTDPLSNSAGSGGTLYAYRETEINIADTSFTGSSSTSHGGTMFLNGVKDAVILNNVTFQNSSSMGRGGAISAQSDGEQKPINLQISNSTFQDSEAYNYGGAIAIGTALPHGSYSSLTVTSSEFLGNSTDNSQDGYGGAIAVFGTDIQNIAINSSVFSGNEAELRGGAIFVQDIYEVAIVASKFLENNAQGISGSNDKYGGGIFIDQVDTAIVNNSFFAGNTVNQGNSSSAIGGGFYGQNLNAFNMYNSFFVENSSSQNGAGLALDVVTTVSIINNNFISSANSESVWLNNATGSAVNNVFYNNSIQAVNAPSSVTFSYNNWNGNGADLSGGASMTIGSDGNISDTPDFTAYTQDGNFENDNYVLQCSSALIDAGDPSYSDVSTGSCSNNTPISDMGAYGGFGLLDDDNDGVTALFDCDDTSNTTFPGAAENESLTECMRDADEDGYGDMSTGGTIVAGTDCDDSDDDTFTGAAENESTTQCMQDSDNDGYGNDSPSNSNVTSGDDCDDSNAAISPSAVEDPSNSIDENCDGSITSVDSDGDGFSIPIDCDDADASINPDADEYCDEIDNNCDGLTDGDDSIDATLWYIDVDSDGYGEDNNFNELSCEQPDGYVDNADDCNPFDAESYPGATEVPDDGIDQDCDGSDSSASEPSEEPASEPSEPSEPAGEPSSEIEDSDGDGIPDNEDLDDDNDGWLDDEDDFPYDSSEYLDTDGDGVGDNADLDADGNGIIDSEEVDSEKGGCGNSSDASLWLLFPAIFCRGLRRKT